MYSFVAKKVLCLVGAHFIMIRQIVSQAEKEKHLRSNARLPQESYKWNVMVNILALLQKLISGL